MTTLALLVLTVILGHSGFGFTTPFVISRLPANVSLSRSQAHVMAISCNVNSQYWDDFTIKCVADIMDDSSIMDFFCYISFDNQNSSQRCVDIISNSIIDSYICKSLLILLSFNSSPTVRLLATLRLAAHEDSWLLCVYVSTQLLRDDLSVADKMQLYKSITHLPLVALYLSNSIVDCYLHADELETFAQAATLLQDCKLYDIHSAKASAAILRAGNNSKMYIALHVLGQMPQHAMHARAELVQISKSNNPQLAKMAKQLLSMIDKQN